jgi:hypothetical protein
LAAASSDWAAIAVARALQNIADARLAEPEETQQHIVPARGLLRPAMTVANRSQRFEKLRMRSI